MQAALTILIKTFLRPASCLRLVRSIRQYYPDIEILIADDSEEDLSVTPPSFDGLGPLRVIQLPFYCGVSAGRNVLIDAAKTPYVLLLDDDFVFTPATKLEDALALLLSNPDLALVAGLFDDGYVMHGRLELSGDTLTIQKGVASGLSASGLPLYDLTHNFFVARREALCMVRWDEELKTNEHIEFFVRAKRLGGLRCTCLSSLQIQHSREDPPAKYAEYRFSHVRHFGALSWQRMGIHERKILREDGSVEQHSVFRPEAAQTAEGQLIQRYKRLFCEALREDAASLSEVAQRDALFRSHHLTALAPWPASPSCDEKIEAISRELFARELISREFLRINGVLQIHAPRPPELWPMSVAPETSSQRAVAERLSAMSLDAGDGAIWAWLGVSPLVAQHVSQRGEVASLRSAGSPTQGTLGDGFYVTLQSHYAALYSMGRLGYRGVTASEHGYTLLLCRVWPGRVYPITRELDYTGLSTHPGRSTRCDHWGRPLRDGFNAHFGLVSEGSYWQVADPINADCSELVVSSHAQIQLTAVVFFCLAGHYSAA